MNNKAFLINNFKGHDYLQTNKLWLSYHGHKEKFLKFLPDPEFEFIEFSYKFRLFKRYGNKAGKTDFRELLGIFD